MIKIVKLFLSRDISRHLHTSCSVMSGKLTQKEFENKTLRDQIRDEKLQGKEMFEDVKTKNKETFKGALEIFKNRDSRRRGAVEFIKAALKHMKDFGVEKDLEVYKALIDVMPKGIYVPQNSIQAGFFHYPKQQECLVDVLGQMSVNKVSPDKETGQLIQSICGLDSSPYRKFGRMRYWNSKFANLSPFPLPLEVPDDALTLAQMAIERITCVDRATIISTHDIEEKLGEQAEDKTWIVSGMSPKQRELLSDWPQKSTIYVEGAFRVWLRSAQVTYFVLRGHSRPQRPAHSSYNVDDLSKIKVWTHRSIKDDPGALIPEQSVHELKDGTILACCATGTSSKDSLLSWIRILELENPNLKHLQVLFTLKQAWSPIKPITKEDLTLRPLK